MGSQQSAAFPNRIQDGIPSEIQRNENGKCQTSRKTWMTFNWNLRAPVMITLFPARLQDGIPRDDQRNENRNCLTGKKTWANFHRISQAPVMILLFPQRPRMGSQGAMKGTKTEHGWQVKKPERLFIEFCELLSGSGFSYKDPGWHRKGKPKERKRKMLDK